jgi:EF hand domain-containing protein
MKHNSLVRVMAGLVLSAGLVLGCDDEEGEDVVLPNGQVVYADIDTNGDGRISPAEWNGYYSGWDANGNGVIDPAEWDVGRAFGTLDLNGNGALDAPEYNAAFGALDGNGDGYLAPSELPFV